MSGKEALNTIEACRRQLSDKVANFMKLVGETSDEISKKYGEEVRIVVEQNDYNCFCILVEKKYWVVFRKRFILCRLDADRGALTRDQQYVTFLLGDPAQCSRAWSEILSMTSVGMLFNELLGSPET